MSNSKLNQLTSSAKDREDLEGYADQIQSQKTKRMKRGEHPCQNPCCSLINDILQTWRIDKG